MRLIKASFWTLLVVFYSYSALASARPRELRSVNFVQQRNNFNGFNYRLELSGQSRGIAHMDNLSLRSGDHLSCYPDFARGGNQLLVVNTPGGMTLAENSILSVRGHDTGSFVTVFSGGAMNNMGFMDVRRANVVLYANNVSNTILNTPEDSPIFSLDLQSSQVRTLTGVTTPHTVGNIWGRSMVYIFSEDSGMSLESFAVPTAPNSGLSNTPIIADDNDISVPNTQADASSGLITMSDSDMIIANDDDGTLERAQTGGSNQQTPVLENAPLAPAPVLPLEIASALEHMGLNSDSPQSVQTSPEPAPEASKSEQTDLLLVPLDEMEGMGPELAEEEKFLQQERGRIK